MGSAIAAWFTTKGVGLLLGALVKLLIDGFSSYQSNQAQRRAGAAETANEVNVKTLETIDAMENVPRPSDDAVADSLRSGRF
jgi:hypothetical protein